MKFSLSDRKSLKMGYKARRLGFGFKGTVTQLSLGLVVASDFELIYRFR